jgi:hypothetical protein
MDKCVKEHNGIMIGISSCPESCRMVDKCFQSASGELSIDSNDETSNVLSIGSSTENETTSNLSSLNSPSDFVPKNDPCKDAVSFRLGGDPDKDCAWLSQNESCELEHDETGKMIGRFYCPESCGLLEASCFVGGDEDTLVSNSGENIMSSLQGNKTTSNVETGGDDFLSDEAQAGGFDNGKDSVFTSNSDKNNTAEESLDGKWGVLEHEVQQWVGDALAKQEIENELENEWNNNNTSWAGVKMGDDAVDAGGKYNNDEYGYDDAYGDDNEYNYGNEPNWNTNSGFVQEKDLDWNKNENVYNENQGYSQNGNVYNQPAEVSTVSIGNSYLTLN